MIAGYGKKTLIADLNKTYNCCFSENEKINKIYEIQKISNGEFVVSTNQGEWTFKKVDMSISY